MVNLDERDPRTLGYERTVERCIRKTSATNRGWLERFLRNREAGGARLSTRRSYAEAVARLDDSVLGRPFAETKADDLARLFMRMAGRYSPATVHTNQSYLRAFLRWLWDELDQPLPRSLVKAFRRKAVQRLANRDPISDGEFDALLKAIFGDLLKEAIVWTLRDAGFRVSELVALNVGSVGFRNTDEAMLTIPADGKHLKTGARSVPVKRCIRHLRAIIQLNPLRADPTSPLFFSPRFAGRRISIQTINQFLRQAARRAGIRHIRPHDLRHTRCTEAARNGFSEAQLRLFFGWAKSSRMPADGSAGRRPASTTNRSSRNPFPNLYPTHAKRRKSSRQLYEVKENGTKRNPSGVVQTTGSHTTIDELLGRGQPESTRAGAVLDEVLVKDQPNGSLPRPQSPRPPDDSARNGESAW